MQEPPRDIGLRDRGDDDRRHRRRGAPHAADAPRYARQSRRHRGRAAATARAQPHPIAASPTSRSPHRRAEWHLHRLCGGQDDFRRSSGDRVARCVTPGCAVLLVQSWPVTTVWPSSETLAFGALLLMRPVKTPDGAPPLARTAFALPFRPAATAYFSSYLPATTAVTSHLNVFV